LCKRKKCAEHTGLDFFSEGEELCLQYAEEYIELLGEIGQGLLSFDDVKDQETSEEEYYAKVLLEGIMVKWENHALKQKHISPELSMNSITMYTQDQMVKMVSASM